MYIYTYTYVCLYVTSVHFTYMSCLDGRGRTETEEG